MDPSFIQHLLDLNCADANKRKEAEEVKEKQLQHNRCQYLASLTGALVNDSVDETARELAGIIIKNAVSGPSESVTQQNQQLWRNIPSAQRQDIKQKLLSGLASTSNPARKSASFAVSSIAVAELTVNEWVDLIPTLANGIKQNNHVVQEGALRAIGLICEDIDIIPDCLAAQSGEILNVIVLCAKPELPVEVRRASIRAMYGALGIVAANFAKKEERDYIMQITCNACKESDEIIQTQALRCLVKTAELYYEFLELDYMKAIWQITSQIMTTDSASAPFTVEFWSTIAETERDIQDETYENLGETSEYPEFATKILPELVPRLCSNLLKQVDTTFDEDEWNIASASAACIAILSECTQEKIIPVIVPFIGEIKSENWRQREASTMAFGSILNARCDAEQVVELVKTVIGFLLHNLKEDPNDCVRSTSAWAISKIASCHPTIIQYDPKHVLSTLVIGLGNSDAVVAYYSCFGILEILSNIYAGRYAEDTNELSPLFLPLMEQLIRAADREDSDESKLRITAYEATNSLIEVCPMDCLEQVKKVVPEFLRKLEASFNVNMDPSEQMATHAYISLVLQTITKRIGAGITPFSQTVFVALTKIFTTRKAIVDEALNAIASLFVEDPNLIANNLQNFQPFLMEALRNQREVSILKSGLFCLGSLCDALGDKLYSFDQGKFCNEVVMTLSGHLRVDTTDRSLRPLIITSFADIALAIGEHFARHFNEFFHIFSAAADVTIAPNETNDDYIDYVIALREAILEAIPPIMDSMLLAKQQEVFISSLNKIVPYMQLLWQDKDFRTRSIVSCMIGILGDLLKNIVPSMSPEHVNSFISMPFVHDMLQHGIQKSNNPETKQTAIWAQAQLNAVRK